MHNLKIDDILKNHSLNPNIGLSSKKAKERLEKNGYNEISTKKKISFFKIFLKQFLDLMIYILFIVALISIILNEYIDAGLIFAVIMINALLGSIQEYKANKSIESIKKLSATTSTVIRDGMEIIIPSRELVKGDIITLNTGDIVGADIRLISTNYLKINESHLTGESLPILKDANAILKDDTPLAERLNMAYMGTIITNGSGKGIVVNCAKESEIGNISNLIESEKNKDTPLQVEIKKLGKRLIIITGILILLVFLINILLHLILKTSNESITNILKDASFTSIALGVAAIPEGLPATVSIILSLGMKILSKKGAIIKSLPAVEALGAVNIICTDKTGTLTENKMQIKNIITLDNLNDNEFLNLDNNILKNKSYYNSIMYPILCSDAKITILSDRIEKIGDPTELAFYDLFLDLKYDFEKDLKNYEIISKIPFSSESKKMSVLVKYNNKNMVIIKGAIDFLLDKIKSYDLKKSLILKNEEMAKNALRTLLVIKKEVSDNFDLEKVETLDDFDFVGLIAMYDPPKKEVKQSIEKAYKAGIKCVVITGDNKETALAISKEVGIKASPETVLNATELNNLSDDEFIEKIKDVNVFARVSPFDKLRIIKGYQKLGYTTAMTGDGVNDGPALKTADIGISMGKGGTEVAKDAAKLILADDNYKTIIDSVEEGRGFYKNIKKAISFLLSCNLGEIIAILLISIIFAIILKKAITPFSAVEILWINLVTDSLMALSLGFDKKEDSIMSNPPRKKEDSFLAKKNWLSILFQGFIIGFVTFMAYLIGYFITKDLKTAQTMAFMTLAISELFHAFSVRDEIKTAFKEKFNIVLFISFFISLTMQIIIYFIPFFKDKVFNIASLNYSLWLSIFLLSIFPLVLIEIIKVFKRINKKRSKF